MRAVGEHRCLAEHRHGTWIEAVWGAPAPGEKRFKEAQAPLAQAMGSACRQTHWGRAGVFTVDWAALGPQLALPPGSTVDSTPPWDSCEPGITQRNVLPG